MTWRLLPQLENVVVRYRGIEGKGKKRYVQFGVPTNGAFTERIWGSKIAVSYRTIFYSSSALTAACGEDWQTPKLGGNANLPPRLRNELELQFYILHCVFLQRCHLWSCKESNGRSTTLIIAI